ncbi:hypothetical protein [Salinihabitans flavidus]|nr:hypothetical protein [Salinihabitans flavidus]
MKLSDQAYLTLAIWGVTAIAFFVAVYEAQWNLAFVALATLALGVIPTLLAEYVRIVVPRAFQAAIALFVFATLLLGEVYGFYDRFWWWDILMHGGSAIGFGLIGFLVVFTMFQGDRYTAPHWALAFFGFCFAVAIGSIWEIFEFAMDQIFGFNMQRSGLMDTMLDMIVNVCGATLGALAGFFYLKGRDKSGLSAAIADFVARNPRLFGRAKRPRRTDRK